MKRYALTDTDQKLIQIGLEVLAHNFDDGIYNHTVSCAILCKNGNIYKGVNCVRAFPATTLYIRK